MLTLRYRPEVGEHLVAGEMSQPVVDVLEVVEIEQQQGVAGLEGVEQCVHVAAVADAGQIVRHGGDRQEIERFLLAGGLGVTRWSSPRGSPMSTAPGMAMTGLDGFPEGWTADRSGTR